MDPWWGELNGTIFKHARTNFCLLIVDMVLVVKYIGMWLAGMLAGYGLFRWVEARRKTSVLADLELLQQQARREAETILREAKLAASEEMLRKSDEFTRSIADRKSELVVIEERMERRESLINQQIEGVVWQERMLQQQQEDVEKVRKQVTKELLEAEQVFKERKALLESAARLSEAEARQALLRQVEEEALEDSNKLTRHILEAAKSRAEDQARRIIGLAIQRYASEHTFETTTATVALQGDDSKGRIIGREGRNIRAFEAATGVTVLIDDTPNAVVLSAYDPVRREIAREAMRRLILDGRIHPTRIEEVVGKVTQEMDESIIRFGEEAVFKLGLAPLHPETVKLLGRLRFRHSYSQNILDHSIEVAHFCGLMASELGVDIAMAKRAGLLHDIGKALSHEMEGAHALVGAEFLRKHGESEPIVNGVASHHEEVAPTGIYGILVGAADAISASRPGARSESMTTYLKRLEDLEKIGLSFDGVEKCFAIQAGREIRVVLQPDRVNDQDAFVMARKIARKIEEELQYPGQIRITVVRESRFIEYAK